MIVCIGSHNIPKRSAIARAFSRYPELINTNESMEFMTISKEKRGEEIGNRKDKLSEVSCIPNGIDEITLGAKNRAKNAYEYAKQVKRHLPLWSRIRIWDVFNERSRNSIFKL